MRLAIKCVLLGLITVNAVFAQSPIVSDFDHDTTAFRIQGAHQIAQCGDCHNRGQFAATPVNCNGCHIAGGSVAASAKPAFHMLTTSSCDSCHTEFGWVPTTEVDHNEVLGSCSSCHNNRVALGKPLNHLPTTADCGSCHRTTLFALASFSHNGIASGCAQCHNNRIAQGKPADHIPAPDTCEDCHQTRTFSLASSVSRPDDAMREYIKGNRAIAGQQRARGDQP